MKKQTERFCGNGIIITERNEVSEVIVGTLEGDLTKCTVPNEILIDTIVFIKNMIVYKGVPSKDEIQQYISKRKNIA